MQKDLSGSDRLNQQCVSLFGEGLNVADVHLYVKVSQQKVTRGRSYIGPHCMYCAIVMNGLLFFF